MRGRKTKRNKDRIKEGKIWRRVEVEKDKKKKEKRRTGGRKDQEQGGRNNKLEAGNK